MSAPNSSCRYAVIRTDLIGAPVGVTYSVVAVHAVDGNGGLVVSQMTLGQPVTYSPPTLIPRDLVIAMLRNSADASAFAARLRREDAEVEAHG
jgi:hypothetical protein